MTLLMQRGLVLRQGRQITGLGQALASRHRVSSQGWPLCAEQTLRSGW